MTWATKRKLQYISIVLLFLAVFVGIPAYFVFHKAPTCSDGKQNQNEDDVDCGGVCIKLCRPLELQPVVQWRQTFEVVGGVYTAVAYIQNPNVGAESQRVGYTFSFYDANNTLIGEKRGVMYIPPGKNFAVLETGLKFSQTPHRTFFDISQNFTWTKAPEYPELAVRDIKIVDEDSSPIVEANIINKTFTPIRETMVTALVYDEEGNAFAASRTVVRNLEKESTRAVVFTWPQPFEKAISRVEIIPVIILVK